MKRSRNNLNALLVCLLMLIGFNAVIWRTARHSYRHQMLTRLNQLPTNVDCIFLGNSLVEAGCDMAAFDSSRPSEFQDLIPVNLGLGATSPVEQYLVLRCALQRAPHLKYLFYGFFDDQLFSPPRGPWSDLVGNRAFSYYFPRESAHFYAPGSWLEPWELRLTGWVPMLAERSSLWGKVELLRRSWGDVGLPKEKWNRFGRAADFAALEAADLPSFEKRCRTAVKQGVFSEPVQAIVRLAREHGATVVLLEMPLPSRHRQVFYASQAWASLRLTTEALARREGVLYLAADDWVPADRYFEDATHLNEEGARLFSRRLAEELPNVLVGTRARSNSGWSADVAGVASK